MRYLYTVGSEILSALETWETAPLVEKTPCFSKAEITSIFSSEVVLDGDTGIFEIVELIMLSVILFIELSSVSVYGDLSFWGKRLNASSLCRANL